MFSMSWGRGLVVDGDNDGVDVFYFGDHKKRSLKGTLRSGEDLLLTTKVAIVEIEFRKKCL